jgi:deoxyribose-phosphate aldolase
LARFIDHALLHPALSLSDLRSGLELCREQKVWSVCVRPCDVRFAAEYLSGAATLVCSVVAFPHGNSTTDVKLCETERALADGAKEIDYVINVSAAIRGEFAAIRDEMQALNRAVQSRGALLKVIFENAYLDDRTRVELCRIAKQVQVAFVKTSTGFAVPANQPANAIGATIEDVQLMVREASPQCQVKASGGIRDLDTMERFLEAGATRIGTSATRLILEQARGRNRT